MLKIVYSFFLGVLLAIFVGFGIATFYPEPKAPIYPVELETSRAELSAAQKDLEVDYRYDYEAYQAESQRYNRNVSIIALVSAVLLLVIGLALESRIGLLADGLLLGGTFTLVYSIGRSFAANNPKYSFFVIAAGLIITVVMGYFKFIRPPTKPKPKAKAKNK